MNKYSAATRLIHWIMAVGFLFMWVLGYTMTTWIEEDSALQSTMFFVHISVGVTLAVLLVFRVVVRIVSGAPPLPSGFFLLERATSKIVHFALYLLPAAVIVLGWASVELGGHRVSWFGLDIPAMLSEGDDNLVEAWHKWLAYTMLVVAALHVSAAVKHRIEERDVLYRITWP